MSKDKDPRPKPETVIRLIDGEPNAHIATTSPSFFKRLINRGYDPEHQRIEGETAYFCIPRFALAIRQCRKRQNDAS